MMVMIREVDERAQAAIRASSKEMLAMFAGDFPVRGKPPTTSGRQ